MSPLSLPLRSPRLAPRLPRSDQTTTKQPAITPAVAKAAANGSEMAIKSNGIPNPQRYHTFMEPTSPLRQALRADPTARKIVAEWRRLTGGASVDEHRATLLACSGGADSSALVLALATTPARLIVGHVIHDMRSAETSAADAERVRELAIRVGVPCVTTTISARPEGGNLEAVSRRMRYRQLSAMAQETGCAFIATGHHAGDQAETVLMRLMRGVGTAGIGCIRPKRNLDSGVHLVRPMLGVTRADAEAVCRNAEWAWCEDATNTEVGLRAALRHQVLPLLDALSPLASASLARSASVLGEQGAAIERWATMVEHSAAVTGEGGSWPRDLLRTLPEIVVIALFRRAARDGGSLADAAMCRSAARAARDDKRHERIFDTRDRRITIDAERVRISPTPGAGKRPDFPLRTKGES